MLDLVNLESRQKSRIQIEISLGKNIEMLQPINALIASIRTENTKIKSLLANITSGINAITKFNSDLIRQLEIFVAKATASLQSTVDTHFQKSG